MHGILFVISVKCILMIDMFLLSVTIFRSIIRDEIIPHAVLWFPWGFSRVPWGFTRRWRWDDRFSSVVLLNELRMSEFDVAEIWWGMYNGRKNMRRSLCLLHLSFHLVLFLFFQIACPFMIGIYSRHLHKLSNLCIFKYLLEAAPFYMDVRFLNGWDFKFVY